MLCTHQYLCIHKSAHKYTCVRRSYTVYTNLTCRNLAYVYCPINCNKFVRKTRHSFCHPTLQNYVLLRIPSVFVSLYLAKLKSMNCQIEVITERAGKNIPFARNAKKYATFATVKGFIQSVFLPDLYNLFTFLQKFLKFSQITD
jgi:hypothetical protein